MKILMINKFLYQNGGSETYMFKLGEYLKSLGHSVEYFGMAHPDNIVKNSANAYTQNMDFHNCNPIQKIKLSLKTIYSKEAYEKTLEVIDKFKPDIIHLNNYNFQLTPSIIYAAKKRNVAIVQTVHDCQIACPNHRMYIESTQKNCDRCLDGGYTNCIKQKCISNSTAKSVCASIESYLYHGKNTYNLVDKYICPSRYMASVIKRGNVEENRIEVIHNFCEIPSKDYTIKDSEKYVLYFGRISVEKGIKTLVEAIKELPDIKFIFVGDGPLDDICKNIPNLTLAGRKSGDELKTYIANASFSVCPSEWYENCPMSIIESLALSTPVIGANIGGIPELIKENETGLIFNSADKNDLKEKIRLLWNDDNKRNYMCRRCLEESDNTIEKYTDALLKIYKDCLK